ncbi:chorismate mutase [SAR202 cluster bacterium AC-409-J13_OGT_754m]|nr:chorismate mutase [SAR202 cluster bacterium AC-409-J13_OGT_754m]
MTNCWGIRGATTVDDDNGESILEATRELLEAIMDANQLDKSQVAAIWFTTTSDLKAEFPALAARKMGWDKVALLCAHEMNVPNSLPKCIRVLLLVNTNKAAEDLKFVYLREARGLRDHGSHDEE